MNTMDKIKEEFASLSDNYDAFIEKGTKAAATRARVAAAAMGHLLKELRKEIQASKNEK